MKKILKSNTFIDLVNIIIKYLVGILSGSMTLFTESLYNISTLLKYNSASYNVEKKNDKKENIYNIVVGAVITILGTIMILNIVNSKPYQIKWYVILASIICILLSNSSASIKYTLGFNDKKEELINVSRNYMMSMVFPWLTILTYLLTLLGNHIKILKYADLVSALVISIYIILIGLKYIAMNFNDLDLDSKNLSKDDVIKTMTDISFIKKINKSKLIKYGANYKLDLDLSIDKTLDNVSAYQLFLGLCNKIFKEYKNIEVISIIKGPYIEKKVVKKSARNSRSRNSKKNTSKKNTKQKNKKS